MSDSVGEIVILSRSAAKNLAFSYQEEISE